MNRRAITALGPWSLSVFDVDHFCGATPYAVRLTTSGGRVVAYSGDTEWTDNLFKVADGADLFVCESYMFNKHVRYHLSYRELNRRANRLGRYLRSRGVSRETRVGLATSEGMAAKRKYAILGVFIVAAIFTPP